MSARPTANVRQYTARHLQIPLANEGPRPRRTATRRTRRPRSLGQEAQSPGRVRLSYISNRFLRFRPPHGPPQRRKVGNLDQQKIKYINKFQNCPRNTNVYARVLPSQHPAGRNNITNIHIRTSGRAGKVICSFFQYVLIPKRLVVGLFPIM